MSIKFTAPNSLDIPQGTKAGDTFKALAEFRVEESGELALVSVDGTQIEDTKEKDIEKGKEKFSNAQGKRKSMQVMISALSPEAKEGLSPQNQMQE